jgi:uncharacterized membrane protein
MTTLPSNAGTKPRSLGAMLLVGASYPLFAHVAVLSGRPALIASSIGLLVILILFPGLRSGRVLAWVVLLAAGLALIAAAESAHTLLLLFLPPILINGFMSWVFGHTLQRGRTPLIERAIVAVHGTSANLTSDIVAYARQLTLVWACLFVALTAINLALAALASPGGLLLTVGLHPRVTVPLSAWSLFANVVNYLIVGALFVVEYWLRRGRFPQQSYRGFFDFARRLAGVSEIFRPTTRD